MTESLQNKYILLLRGINVGGNNLLPMAELRDLLECLDCKNVKTYIQSGNVIVESHESRSSLQYSVQEKIETEKNFKVNVLVIAFEQFKKAVLDCPFNTDEGKFLHYYFLAEKPKAVQWEILASLKAESEKYELKEFVFYLYAPDGIGRSKLAAKVEKALGVAVTARNHNTVQKLIQLGE